MTAGRRVAGAQCVAVTKLQRIDGAKFGQFVHQGFVRQGGLWHAKAAECTGWWPIGEDRPRLGVHVSDPVRPHTMHRHATRDGRSPGGISTGIEVAAEVVALERAVSIRRCGGFDRGRMSLCARRHGFRTRIDGAHWRVQQPRGQRD